MPVDEETRRKIVELYLIEHKTIRDISKLSKKSSRDIVAGFKEFRAQWKSRGK